MPLHLQREINRLKKRLLGLSGLVEENVENAVRALTEHNSELAVRVIEYDKEIDNMEVEVEEECLKILALHQPVAIDLRFITAVMRINNDLERIGDIAVNMAERSLIFNACTTPPFIPKEFASTARKAQQLLTQSLDALVNMDADAARIVLVEDDEIDNLCRRMYEEIKDEISNHPDQIDTLSHVLILPRCVERIADHATNISEDLIYMVEGAIIRHSAH
jgi:phosphate transport system protein